MLTIQEQIYARGREEGREEGREIQIRMILQILRARFDKVPSTICKRVSEMKDAVALQSLAIAAATSPTLQDFQRNL